MIFMIDITLFYHCKWVGSAQSYNETKKHN